MRAVLGLIGLMVLASCGADGAPVAPGVSVSGQVTMGLAKDGG